MLIGQILPPEAAAAELVGEVPIGYLLPEERSAVAGAAEKRRNEFSAGRACARAALAKLGLPPVALPVGLAGAPEWPTGITGSITHCDGYRSAAVAHASVIRSMGIDGEPDQALPRDVLDIIASDAEKAHLAEVGDALPGVSWDRLMFSAKESVYKAWYPVTAQWLDFAQVSVTISPFQGSFTARVRHPSARAVSFSCMGGRWVAAMGFIVTAVLIRNQERDP